MHTHTHTHTHTGVKVNGQWRLLDPTTASLHRGRDTPSAPFFVPPLAFIYAYFPLEDHWQLLPETMPLARWCVCVCVRACVRACVDGMV